MSDPLRFRIAVSDADLALLKQKLTQARLPDELDDAGWSYGVPLADVRRLTAHWRDSYDWRAHEAQINDDLPQYTRDIEVEGEGVLNVHFVHQRSTVQEAVPLLFVHGWPGHFLEVRKILPLLTAATREGPSFHVVALSLPNYGFSERTTTRGFRAAQYAETAHKLMLSLGYDEYVTQGGDWGFIVTRKIAQEYGPKHAKAWHTNMSIGLPPRPTSNPVLWLQHALTPYSAAEKIGLQRTGWFRKMGSGYFAEQSTQPQTLGYALADSPVGLLAWIYEKLVNWTDAYPWTDDEVLTWVSIYWFSRAGPAASLRIYYEVVQGSDMVIPQVMTIPMGISFFPKELVIPPKTWCRTVGKVVFESSHENGGHFAAFEKPEELTADVRKMFGKGGPAFGVVRGKEGYQTSADHPATSRL